MGWVASKILAVSCLVFPSVQIFSCWISHCLETRPGQPPLSSLPPASKAVLTNGTLKPTGFFLELIPPSCRLPKSNVLFSKLALTLLVEIQV